MTKYFFTNTFEIGYSHCSPLDIIEDINIKNIQSFCIVRHPLDWYKSLYRWYHQRNWPQKKFSKSDFSHTCCAKTFTEYIQNSMEHFQYGYATAYFSRYFPFTTHVLHTRNLTHQLGQLLKKWNYSTSINKIKENISDKKIDTSLPQELYDKVIKKESGIIRYLNL
jgi:hypothetical protein